MEALVDGTLRRWVIAVVQMAENDAACFGIEIAGVIYEGNPETKSLLGLSVALARNLYTGIQILLFVH